MTYQLTLLKYAHFQKVLQESHFLKLNIINKLISKVKLIEKIHILKRKLFRMTFNYQKLNFYNIVQKRVRHDILEITIQCNVEISQPQRAECTSRSHQLQISRNRAD